MDPADDDRVRWDAGADCRDGLVSAHASAGGAARAAGVGRRADAYVGGRHDPRGVDALLAESRSGKHGGVLPWALLVVGSVASLAANVAVAEPSVTRRLIAAWPSFALIASYELLMRQIRAAPAEASPRRPIARAPAATPVPRIRSAAYEPADHARERASARSLRQDALAWAMANRGEDGRLPSGKAIADRFGRQERWGRLVKQYGDNAQPATNPPGAAA